jgi:hypothetical protein
MKKTLFQKILVLSLVCVMILGGCGQNTAVRTEKTKVTASKTVTAEKEYDEQVTGVIKRIEEEKKTVLVQEISTAEEIVLNYTDLTEAYNKYGDLKTVSQFCAGDIVEAYFLSDENELVRMENSSSAWIYEDVKKFTVQREKEILKISDHRYQYDPVSLLVVEGGEQIDLMNINENDTLSIQGIGSRIYSITVTKGHGYVRFKNYDQFVGGMVEIGYGIIRNVTEDMLLTVPEGSYRMVMEHGKLLAEKEITVERGAEQVVDLSAYQTEVEKTGKVYFVIDPEGAQLNINGVPAVYTDAVELNYGKNIIQVFKDGYSSYTGKLNVKRAYQVVKISLAEESSDAEVVSSTDEDTAEGTQETDSTTETSESKSDQTDSSGEDSDSSDSSGDSDDSGSSDDSDTADSSDDESEDTTIETADAGTTETDSEHTVTVNSPSNVKVYVNDEYIGKSPVSFEKIIGTFTVTLSKKGYQTVSYTLTLEDDGESSSLSFPDLVESEE